MTGKSEARMRRVHQSDEQGIVLIVAVMVMSVTLILSLIIVNVAITSGRTSGRDRQRLVAINAAEAGIDGAYAVIQTSGVSLPCTWPASGSTDVKTYPDPASVSARIDYYLADSSAALSCTGTLAPGNYPSRAVISSWGTAGPLAGRVTRKMEALVNLVPVGGGNGILSDSIVGDRGITMTSAASINGGVGADADVYTNGNYSCSSSPEIHGKIIAPFGSVSMSQTCTAYGDVWARDNVASSGNKTLGANVLSSLGIVNLSSSTNVTGTVTARTTDAISWPNPPCTRSNCRANPVLPNPPSQPFPIINNDDATLQKWRDQGYAVISQPSSTACGSAAGDWIAAQAPAFTQKTLLLTNCQVTFASTGTINFAKDFALFASGGISTSQQVRFDASSPRSINMIVPDNAATPPCSAPNITVANNFSSTVNVTQLWYSPCDISYANGGGSYGAVYSGSNLIASQSFSLNYRPIQLYGVVPSSQPPLSYKVDILYKREDRV